MNSIRSLHSSDGMLMIDALDDFIKKNMIAPKYWVGFAHNVPKHNRSIEFFYGKENDVDLDKMFKSETWNKNRNKCKGIFCLSEYNAKFVKSLIGEKINISVVYHATEVPNIIFEWNKFLSNDDKSVYFIGHWCRNFQPFYDLETSYKKKILKLPDNIFRYDLLAKYYNVNNTVNFEENKTNEEYDKLLSKNLVFLNLFDSSANNVIIECMARNTPLLVNRLPAIEEYLGKEYPFFYETAEEASMKIKNLDLIKNTHLYISTSGIKDKIRKDNFYQGILNSKITKKIKSFV